MALQLGLRRTLCHAATLIVQSRHLQTLRLAELIRYRPLPRLILHHIYLRKVILLINALVTTSYFIVLLLLVRASLTRKVVGQVARRVDWHVVTDGTATTVQALLAPLITGHVVRLLAHLIMQDAPIAHVGYLLHVLPAATATDHTRAVDLRQLEGRLARVSYQADVVRVLLASKVRLVPVLIY